jgi:hypothetical protein
MRTILIAAIAILWISAEACAQWPMRPGAYGYGPFHWGSGRYWGGWGGWSPGPRYYNYGAYSWQGWPPQRWRYYGY